MHNEPLTLDLGANAGRPPRHNVDVIESTHLRTCWSRVNERLGLLLGESDLRRRGEEM